MEARYVRTVILAAVLLASMGASHRTKNFVVEAPDARLAAEAAQAAEKYRHDLAVSWLGKPMPDWSSPCVTTIRVGKNLGAGGATTFVFDRGEVYGWRMTIQGSRQRLLDSVLPHEITHTILATHFRRPLPRWADEGAATSVEHIKERTKYYQMLQKFLRTGRGISFTSMFAMTEYPPDVLPLYSQGFTLADFLIRQGGRQKFIAFIDDGLRSNRWAEAIDRHYDCGNLKTLQNNWLAWVKKGCPSIEPDRDLLIAATGQMLAANDSLPKTNTLAGTQPWRVTETSPLRMAPSAKRLARPQPNLLLRIPNVKPKEQNFTGVGPVVAIHRPAPADHPVRTQSARPQPVQKSRQIILEWRNR